MLNVTARQELMSKIADTLGVVVEDARFDFEEDGLHIRVVDPSHVAMVKLDVAAAAFETWELDETKVGFDIRKLQELISLGGPNDIVEFSYGEETGVLTINLGKIDRNIRPLDNSTLNPPAVPTLDFPCKVVIGGAEFSQALRAARQVGDLVNFSLSQDSFTIHVQGSADSVTVVFDKDELQSLECKEPARSQYSLTYLVPMTKIFRGLDEVTLGFGDNFPLSMTFSFLDGAADVQYFLAPRVESDI
jgi:proliferating cell nuclear antigen